MSSIKQEPTVVEVFRSQASAQYPGEPATSGPETVDALLSDGKRVRLFTRNPGKPKIADIEMIRQTVAHVRVLAEEAGLLLEDGDR